MATVTAASIPSSDIRQVRMKWEGFAASGDVGTAVALGSWPDRSVQILGTFGTGGEITLQGSNDGGTTWATLTDPQGNSIVKSAAAIEAITEAVHMIRPICSAGSGADIDVYLFFGGYKPS